MDDERISDEQIDQLRERAEKAEAENKRLREALEKIVNTPPYYGSESDILYGIAEEALEREENEDD